MAVSIIIGVLLYAGLHIGLWKLFEKANYKGWYSFVPVLDLIIWLRIIKKPWWWMLILIIPGINIVMFWVMLYNLAEAYGKESAIDRAFAMFLFPIALPMWGFDKHVKFLGMDTNRTRSSAEQWLDAIVFAVIAATIIRTFFIEAFQIPTSSMEKSLMVGDYLFVSKVSYGARSPMTPLTVPFTHSTFPFGDNIQSYVEWVTLPYFRLPGLGKVERGDIVVFNFPEGDTVATKYSNQTYYSIARTLGAQIAKADRMVAVRGLAGQDAAGVKYIKDNPDEFGKVVYRPLDKRDHYVKRCVGLPGDKLEIVNDTLIVNGERQAFPANAQLRYNIFSRSLNDLTKLGSTKEDFKYKNDNSGLPIPFSKLAEYKKLPTIDSLGGVVKQIPNTDRDVLPHDTSLAKWTIQNFGPIHIPKAGETVTLDAMNLAMYGRCIDVYENNDLQVKGGKIFINGQEATTYTFKQDYYWMMGDNRHGSLDSRFWGFVPHDHVVGKPVMVWLSMSPDARFPMNIRWDRLVSFVSRGGISRSYAIHLLLLIILGTVLNTLYKKGKMDFIKRKR
jgi:signal peptidase I